MEKKISIILETEEDEKRILDYFKYRLLDDFEKKRIKLIEVVGDITIKYP